MAKAKQLRAYLTYNDQAIARDLPDIVAIMLATSVRISECLALEWEAVDPEAGMVEVRGNVTRVKVGLDDQPLRVQQA